MTVLSLLLSNTTIEHIIVLTPIKRNYILKS